MGRIAKIVYTIAGGIFGGCLFGSFGAGAGCAYSVASKASEEKFYLPVIIGVSVGGLVGLVGGIIGGIESAKEEEFLHSIPKSDYTPTIEEDMDNSRPVSSIYGAGRW